MKGRGNKSLKKKDVVSLLADNKCITTFEEMCAIRGVDTESVSPEIRRYAEKMIKRNILELKVKIKADLLDGTAKKTSLETLYRLIGNEDELRRLGQAKPSKDEIITEKESVVEVRSADKSIVEKIKKIK